MLKQRIMTALVLLPLVLVLLFVLKLDYFAMALILITYLISLEWATLAGIKSSVFCSIYALLISTINLNLWFFSDSFLFWPSLSWPNQVVLDLPMIALMLALIAIVTAMFIVFTYSKLPKWWANLPMRCLLGLAILPGFFVSLISIRNIHSMADFYYGGQLVLFMFCLIWAADSGAYFAGKAFGKNKLAPVVSPNKTWEGVLGGLLLSYLIAWVGVYLLDLNIKTPIIFSFAIVALTFISVLGDLFESALKRVANIKDSGNLLPGHGGLLDRLDSTIVVAPVFFLIFSSQGWF